MEQLYNYFDEIWCVDFEYIAKGGDLPKPVCVVALEIKTEQLVRTFFDDLESLKAPPFISGDRVLVVAYYASAELGCYIALEWPPPTHILDLYVEFRWIINGTKWTLGAGLLGALAFFNLESLSFSEKSEMRDLILSGGPWDRQQKLAILDYCASDVTALCRLLQAMAPSIDLPRALFRGRYMKAVAKMEAKGIPVDTLTLKVLEKNWLSIQRSLIKNIDAEYKVFDGNTFKYNQFELYLSDKKINWPRLPTGRLDLSDSTFREMAKVHRTISPLHEVRSTLSKMRLADLTIGKDGRNRCLLSPFRSKTGRNQPSNSKFLFGPSVWLRGLIKPAEGMGLAYIDWEQQEFGIAAALSKDPNMMEAYESGDPYLAFAKQAGAVPDGATKASHKVEREQFKQCALAVQYGMGGESLAKRLGKPRFVGDNLLMLHRQTYPKFWKWSDSVVACGVFNGQISTRFGWKIQTKSEENCRSISNFPMQANGAEMLRLACCLASEQGVSICAPVHDAILIESPLSRLDFDIQIMVSSMLEAIDLRT